MGDKSYAIKVHIIEARNIHLLNPPDLPDPVVEVTVAGDPDTEKSSDIFKNTTSALFDAVM